MLFWTSWMDAAQFGFEAQSVIAMRLLKIAIDAGAAAHTAGAIAFLGGKSAEAATKLAMAPIRRRVHANHLRLVRG